MPLVNPFINSTNGTITNINLINTHDTEFTPFSKLVVTFFPTNCFAIEPNIVSSPTLITIAIADPLITLLPIKAKLFNSIGFLLSPIIIVSTFSIGSLSPVKDD